MPSVGWTGPTVLGGLAAAGYRITTSGVHERQGIVHRLDVGTSGVMVVALSERAYTVLKRAFKQRTVDKRYHALVQGHPGSVQRDHRRADRPAPRPRLEVRGHRERPAQRHPLRHRSKPSSAASLLDVASGNRPHPPDPGAFRRAAPSLRGDLTYGADPTLANRLGLERQWLHARSLAFAHPADGRRIEITSPYPPDLQHALDVLREEG